MKIYRKICNCRTLRKLYILTTFLGALNLLFYFTEFDGIQEVYVNETSWAEEPYVKSQRIAQPEMVSFYVKNSIGDSPISPLPKILAHVKIINVFESNSVKKKSLAKPTSDSKIKSAKGKSTMQFLNKLKSKVLDSVTPVKLRTKRNSAFNSHPNLLKNDPSKFRPKNYTSKTKDSCRMPYPQNRDLRFSNLYWQLLRTPKWTLYFFGAYYDPRLRIHGKGNHDIVRIIGIGDKVHIGNGSDKIWCQLWYTNKTKPLLAKVIHSFPIWPKKYGFLRDGFHIPYLFQCNLPMTGEIPFAVSIVKIKCSKAQNKLKVFQTLPKDKKRKDIAVCVKGLDFPHKDISHKLIEWIELVKLLGASKIYFYEFAVESNTRKVLKHYQRNGIVQLMQLSLPGDFPNDPILRHEHLKAHLVTKRQLEIVPYNDCFYRNINMYNYILPMDIDEIIIPKTVRTWPEMLQIARANSSGLNKTSFNAIQNGCYLHGVEREYFADIPKYMHMLQHIYTIAQISTQKYSGTKGFMDTQRVVTLMNHWPYSCLNQYCRMYKFSPNIAYLQHYKHYQRHCGLQRDTKEWNCTKLSCQSYIEDQTIWKFKKALIPKVVKTVKLLKLSIKIK